MTIWKTQLEVLSQNCGCDLARPYVNDQVLTKMYNLECALKYGTIFPELNLYDSEMYNPDIILSPKKRVGGRR